MVGQRQRRSVPQKVTVTKSAGKRVEKVAFTSTHKFARCRDCNKSLKKWGVGGSIGGALCPPCAETRVEKDRKARVALPIQQGILIDLNSKQALPLDDCRKALGDGMRCGLHHSEHALRHRALDTCFDGIIRDNAINEARVGMLEYNDNAERIVMRLGCFHERTPESLFCKVVVTGPFGQSLYPEEVEYILNL